MKEMELFNKFVAGKEKLGTSLLVLVNAWSLQLLGYLAVLWSIFCSTCFDTITKRIFTALVGVAIVLLGIELGKAKKWAFYTFLILVAIVALFLIIRLRIIFTAIHSFLNK